MCQFRATKQIFGESPTVKQTLLIYCKSLNTAHLLSSITCLIYLCYLHGDAKQCHTSNVEVWALQGQISKANNTTRQVQLHMIQD